MTTPVQIIIRRRRRQQDQRLHARQRITWWVIISVCALFGVIVPGGIAFGSAASIYLDAAADIPAFGENALTIGASTATRLYDRTGETLIHTLQDPITRSDANWVRLDTLPRYVIDATLAVEDIDFLETRPDALGTLGALWQNIFVAPTPPDTSLVGRLARGVIPARGGSLADQRAREVVLIAELQRRYSPQQLLEWHLNSNYYGSEAYGIEAAARIYLDKRAVDLTLDEAALLASIPTAPQYNPFDNEIAARGRQSDTLRVMLNRRLIAPESYEQASAVSTRITSSSTYLPPLAPEFVTTARRQAERILTDQGRDGAGLVARGGLRIITSLDLDLYREAECALDAGLARVNGVTASPLTRDGSPCRTASLLPDVSSYSLRSDGDGFPDSGSVIIIDARTGEIRAMVGAAAREAYQPGITLTPIVYLEGFNGGNSLETPGTMIFDIPTQFPGSQDGLIYTVSNADGRFRGVMNIRDALGAALIPPAASIAYRQGMGSILSTAHQIGINSLDDARYDLMLLERGGAVSLLDMAYAYSVFATEGDMRGVQVEPIARGFRSRDPVAVVRIEAADGTLLWRYDSADAARCGSFATCTPLLQDGLAYLINDILADQETRWSVIGQGSPLDVARPTAVVNGVTADRRENWALGYTPDYVVGVHYGRADSTPVTLDDYGLRGAASVWRALMDYAHSRDGIAGSTWQRPDSVVELRVCDKSGLLPNGVCPVYNEIFLDGTQPQIQDSFWQVREINSRTGQLATASTAAEFRSDAVYFVPPDAALDWWRANNQPLPPEDYDTVSRPELFDSVRIFTPSLFAYVGGTVEIRGELDAANLQYYQLSYGQGLNPTEYIDIGGQQTDYAPGEPLALWDTTGLDGLYTLLLVSVAPDNSYESEAVQVTVDNTPPTVSLELAQPDRVYRFPTDDRIEFIATAQDNLAIARVEFFRDGEYLGADEMYPFGLEWRIDSAGVKTFSATVFDQVGNQSSATLTIEVGRAGS
jgi:membrane peptidoglycan carboxypeptidase